MIAEVLLGSSFVGGSCVLGWLLKIHADDRLRASQEKARLERITADRRACLVDRAVKLLVLAIKEKGIAEFGLGRFCEERGIPAEIATDAAVHLYRKMATKAASDGVVTDAERSQLDKLAAAIGVDNHTSALIEAEVKAARYREVVSDVMEDGVVTGDELAHLERVRKGLGLEQTEAANLFGDDGRGAYYAAIENLINEGAIGADQREKLERMRDLVFPSGSVAADYRARADGLFRKAVAAVLQDGIVEDHERAMLDWLKKVLEPSRELSDVARTSIEKAIKLSEYRAGRLPSLRTKALMDSGELCHHEGACEYFHETKRAVTCYRGTLIISNQKVRFLSPERSLSLAPSRIMDISVDGRHVFLTLDIRQGSALFRVNDPAEVEAILVGVARRNKYTAEFSTEMTRSIPDSVKQEVWIRDGGKCIKCGISHAIQYDHIIPHAKGGANTVANIQLLCSPCNLAKGARI